MTDVPPPAAAAPEETPGLLKCAMKRHAALSALLGRGGPALGEAEFVHDLRVAARRLEEVARLCAPFVDRPAARAVAASLKSLRKSLGELRDSDVLREHFSRWRMPRPVRLLAAENAAALEAGRPNLADDAAVEMTSASLQGAMVVLARVLDEQSAAANASAAESALRKRTGAQLQKRKKQLRKAFGRAAARQTPSSLHEARIAAKKLRYISELAEEVSLESGLKKQVRFLKQLQDLLGAHHDVHVVLEILEKHLHDRRDRPIPQLSRQWPRFRRAMEKGQAQRAADFFVRSYRWMNR
jgi:CHAD domain-containing protein